MSIEYLVEGSKYLFSYTEIRQSYIEFCDMSDEEFLKNLPGAAHLACVICYFKEIPTYVCLSDKGIVHELIHLMHIYDEPLLQLPEIRKLFKETLELS